MSTPYDPQQNQPGEPKRLTRSVTDKMIAGVCGGFAEYLGVDATVIRIIAVFLLFIGIFPAGLAYLIAWAIVPSEI